MKKYIPHMPTRKEGVTIEFRVTDDRFGTDLIESLRRRGVHMHRPYAGREDVVLNKNFVEVRVPERMADSVIERVQCSLGGKLLDVKFLPRR